MWRHLVNLLLFACPPTRLFALRRFLLRSARIDLGDGVCVSGRGWIYGPGPLVIRSGSWLSPGCTLYTHASAQIEIGERCDIGHEVAFVTGSHELGASTRRAGPGTALPIVVGDGTWIGARSVILGGVTIGKGCMIAAGSVVTRDIPDNSFAAGVPALVKRQLRR